MFIQVVQGKTSDAAGLQRQLDRWNREISPGATGFIGSTGGVVDDGTMLALIRFTDEAAARANSERAEQTAWWNETQKYFDGDVTFRDTSDTDAMLAGGSDDAGFVQVMQGRATDRARLAEVEGKFLTTLQERRPDVIGSTRAWFGDQFVEAIYFTSEAAAREGEKKMGGESDMDEFLSLTTDVTFLDLKDPWLFTP